MIDPNILERVAEATGVGEGDHVLEIGPGPGVLTALLLERGASVRAIELDCAMAGYLRVAFTGERLELLVGDILSMSLDSLLGSGQRWTIASNLPYSISTPLLYELPAVAQRLNRVVLTLPVSYTHLDVYKRQTQLSAEALRSSQSMANGVISSADSIPPLPEMCIRDSSWVDE